MPSDTPIYAAPLTPSSTQEKLIGIYGSPKRVVSGYRHLEPFGKVLGTALVSTPLGGRGPGRSDWVRSSLSTGLLRQAVGPETGLNDLVHLRMLVHGLPKSTTPTGLVAPAGKQLPFHQLLSHRTLPHSLADDASTAACDTQSPHSAPRTLGQAAAPQRISIKTTIKNTTTKKPHVAAAPARRERPLRRSAVFGPGSARRH